MTVVFTQTANPASVNASGLIAAYTGVSIGTADANRVVIVLVGTEVAGSEPTQCTIDGHAMNAGTAGSFNVQFARAFWLPWPIGTTANIDVAFSSASPTSNQHSIAVYSATGGVQSSSGADSSTDMDADDPLTTGSITIASGGGFIGVASGSSGTAAKTWANATEDIDAQVSGFRFTTATRTTSGTVTITCQGQGNEDGALSYLVFAPGVNLAATSLDSGTPSVSSPSITQSHALTAMGVSAGVPTVSTVLLSSNSRGGGNGRTFACRTFAAKSFRARTLAGTTIFAAPSYTDRIRLIGTSLHRHAVEGASMQANRVIGTSKEVIRLSGTLP